MDSGGTVIRNSCHANGPTNGGAGIRLTSEKTFVDNNDLAGNYCGILAPAGTAWNIITRNTAHTNNLDIEVAGANVVGPVLASQSNNGWFDVSSWANIAY